MSASRDIQSGMIEDAIRETETEIFNSAFDIDTDDDNNYDDDLEAVEGWDGHSLSDEEIAERNLNGDDDVYFDRPIEGRERDQLASENEQLKAQLAERNAQLDQVQNGPERQEQFRQSAREFLYQQHGILPTDDRIDGLVDQLMQNQQVVQNLQNQRFNQSMAAAHKEYGPDFEHNFKSFVNLPDTPFNRALGQEVWNAPDPGQRMMALSHSFAGAHSTRGMDPSSIWEGGYRSSAYNGGRGRSRNDGDLPRDEMDEGGWGRADIENDIFRSAWDN